VLSGTVPREVLLVPGRPLQLDLTTTSYPKTRETQWAVTGLPPGVTASASQGVVTLTALSGTQSGAFPVRFEASREGSSERHDVRLLLGRMYGDWRLLGRSPAPDGAAPPVTALAVDETGTALVACADPRSKDLRAYGFGEWTVRTALPACGSAHLDITNGLTCFAAMNDDRRGTTSTCWVPPATPTWASFPVAGHVLGSSALAVAEADGINMTFHRGSSRGWTKLGSKTVSRNSPVDLAAPSASGMVVASIALVDKLTPQGWVVRQQVEVVRWSGSGWTVLEGLQANLDFALVGPTAPNLGHLVALEVGADGNPVVAWVDSTDERIHVQRWNGAAWTPLAPPLAPDERFFAYELKLELDPAGAPVIAWLESGFPTADWTQGTLVRPSRVRVHRLVQGAWAELSAAPVSLDESSPMSSIALALDARGVPFVAWQESGWLLVAQYAQ
jgi:hypothetical protein